MRAKREKGLGHQRLTYTIFACPTTLSAWRATISSSFRVLANAAGKRAEVLFDEPEHFSYCTIEAAASQRSDHVRIYPRMFGFIPECRSASFENRLRFSGIPLFHYSST
jgi:hypothetical protein